MSESFFKFKIRCPKCGYMQSKSDGFETDDWVEVFAFSGYSEKSANFGYDPYYECSECGAKTEIEALYIGQYIEMESMDRVVNYLETQLPYVVERGGLGDHGWEPDLDTVLRRYSNLYPTNQKLVELKALYFSAIHNPKFFTKFEPSYGTKIVNADMILYRELLRKIYLPDTVTQIGAEAFSKTKISDIFLPRNIISIGDYAFKGCYNLESVHSSDALATIGDYAFANTEIRRFFFPNNIKEIGTHAFENTLLSEVYIPSGCTTIGDEAFANCWDLKKITISKDFKNVERLFESTAELHYVEKFDENEMDKKKCEFQVDYISSYNGDYAKKQYDLMFNFISLEAISRTYIVGSLNDAMKNSCLSISEEFIKDESYPIGEFKLMDKHDIAITDKLAVVKVLDFREWKRAKNFEIIKGIYEKLLKYAFEHNFSKIAFPLWKQAWDFPYYSDLLMHITAIIKKNNYSFESISWYGSYKDSFYGSSDDMKRELKMLFHLIEVERI